MFLEGNVCGLELRLGRTWLEGLMQSEASDFAEAEALAPAFVGVASIRVMRCFDCC